MSHPSPPPTGTPVLPGLDRKSAASSSAGSTKRTSPVKTDSEEESDALVIRPVVLGKEKAKKRLLAFSVNKLAESPLKQITNKLKNPKKERKGTKALAPADPIAATVQAIEEEKKKEQGALFKEATLKAEAIRQLQQREIDKNRKKSRRSRSRSRGRRRSRSKSPRSSSQTRGKDSSKEKARKSKTPEKKTDPVIELPSDWANLKTAGLILDENFRRLKLRAEKNEEFSLSRASRPEGLVAHRLSEIKPLVNLLNEKPKSRVPLLALPKDSSKDAPPKSYPLKLVRFTSTNPIITWAPHPGLEDDSFCMSRHFYTAHADSKSLELFQNISDARTPQVVESDKNVTAAWYPKVEDAFKSVEVEGSDSNMFLTRKRPGKKERKVSLVAYDSDEDKKTVDDLLLEGATVKVKSKWDSDSSEQDESKPKLTSLHREELQQKSKSSSRASSKRAESPKVKPSSEPPPQKQKQNDKKLEKVEKKQERKRQPSKDNVKNVDEPKKEVVSTPKPDEPQQLVSEYEEFLKLVGTESPPKASPEKMDTSLEKPEPAANPTNPSNEWDVDSGSPNESSIKPKSRTLDKMDKRSINSEPLIKTLPIKKKKKKKLLPKKIKKKRVTSSSDSDSKSSLSSSSASSSDLKKKKKKRKKKKRSKKKIVSKSSSSSESDAKKKIKGKEKKSKKKGKEKESAEKLLLDLQIQKAEIARKLSELDALTDKKSKKAIARDLKSLEAQINKTHKLEGLVVSKKGRKLKKAVKKQKSSSSSSGSEDSDSYKKKEKKKIKKKKAKKRYSSTSESDEEEVKSKKAKKESAKKEKKSKKLDHSKKADVSKIEETDLTEEKIWRKRPAEVELSPILRSRQKLEGDEGSGWEDDDVVKPIESDKKSALSLEIPLEPAKTISKQAVEEKPTWSSREWEAPSEPEAQSPSSEWEAPVQTENKEVRAFQSVSAEPEKPLPASDLYSPGASESADSDTGPKPSGMAYSSDSRITVTPASSMNSITEDRMFKINNKVVFVGQEVQPPAGNEPSFIESNFDRPFLFPNEQSQQYKSLDSIELSKEAPSSSQNDDIYDPLAIDSDMSVEDDLPRATPMIEEIPLPAVPAISEILLPGEMRVTNETVEIKKVIAPKPAAMISPIKVNRWDRPFKAGDSKSGKNMVPLGVVVPQVASVPLPSSPRSVSPGLTSPAPAISAQLPPSPATPQPFLMFSNSSARADKKESPSSTTHVITVKAPQKLKSKVASVFQEDSDEEISGKQPPVNTDVKSKIVEAKEKIEKAIEKEVLSHENASGKSSNDTLDMVERTVVREREEHEDSKRADRYDEKKDANQRDEKDFRDRDRKDGDRRDDKRKDDRKKEGRRRTRSPSPRRRRSSRSPEKREKKDSPERKRSPEKREVRRRSKSPERRDMRRRSKSPDRRDHDRREPRRERGRGSRSPDRRRRRTPSPRRRRSPSPRRRRRPDSPRRRRSRSKSRSHSPRSKRIKRRSRSRSPNRRRSLSPTRRRSPETPSLIPVIGQSVTPMHGQPPPLPSTPYAAQEKPPPGTQHRLTLDQRIELELGVRMEEQMPTPSPADQLPVVPTYYFHGPPPPVYHSVPSYPQPMPPSPLVQVRQVGNIMEVVPGLPPPPPPPPQPKIVQVGNNLQVVPQVPQRVTAVVAPTPVAPDPVPAIELEVLHNPLLKAMQAEREKRRKEKEARKKEREARRKERQAKRCAKLMSVTEKLKKSERNEGLVLGQDLEDEELLLEALEPPSPPGPMEIVVEGDLPPAGKSILVTTGFRRNGDETEKKVMFADGLCPGEASPSGGEDRSPPTKIKQLKEKRLKKKIKKKVKVRIIRQVIESEEEEEDDLPPPSPPPGDPPTILYATFPFGGQVQYPVYHTSVTTTTRTTLHLPTPLADDEVDANDDK